MSAPSPTARLNAYWVFIGASFSPPACAMFRNRRLSQGFASPAAAWAAAPGAAWTAPVVAADAGCARRNDNPTRAATTAGRRFTNRQRSPIAGLARARERGPTAQLAAATSRASGIRKDRLSGLHGALITWQRRSSADSSATTTE